MSVKIAVKEVSFHLRPLQTRLPFRFGAFTLKEVPLLHVAVEVEADNLIPTLGFAADNLMPKWFDKDPAKTPADNIRDLLGSSAMAGWIYEEAGRKPGTVGSIWREAYPLCLREGKRRGWNSLVASFGSSLFERALVDAVGRTCGRDLRGVLRENLLGIQPGDVHPEIHYDDVQAWLDPEMPPYLMLRHTVGLLDPLEAADLTEETDVRDGLPRTLEEYIRRHGLRFFKLKVGGRVEEDFERLQRIASVLDRLIPESYTVTLDGNEQYRSVLDVHRLLRILGEEPGLSRFRRSIAFIEQPLDRVESFGPGMAEGLREISRHCPVIIDESDDRLDAFKTAVDLGYRGVSAKNCKGIIKSFLNRTLIARWNRGRPEADRLFMSAEDLTNVPVVPLQQDLATVRVLGIPHLERNGYHYVRGLAHCSVRERELALARHPDLYTGDRYEAFLRIEDGTIRVGSLSIPGYAVAFDPDLEAMREVLPEIPPPIRHGKNDAEGAA